MSTQLVEDAWTEVKSILTNDTTLKTYIKNVYEGYRQIPHQAFPCIILEPVSEPEEVAMHRRHIDFEITIYALIMVYNADKQIIGDANIKGIVDLVRDIKNALCKYQSLNGKCISHKFPSTEYTFESYPIRQAEISMVIELITATETGR